MTSVQALLRYSSTAIGSGDSGNAGAATAPETTVVAVMVSETIPEAP